MKKHLFALIFCIIALPLFGNTTWEKRAPLLAENSEMSVAQWGNKIFVFGGYPSTRETVGTVQVYDATKDRWQIEPPLPTPVNHSMAAALEGKLYVVGGQEKAGGKANKAQFQDLVQIYDIASKTWSEGSRMPTKRSGGGAAVIKGKIYVAGGRPPHGHDFAVYDPKADQWTLLPKMPTARNHIAVAAIDDRLYVAGGRFGSGFRSEITATLEVYDLKTSQWIVKRPMSMARSGLNGISVNGCFHTFGGEHPSAGSSGVFPNHEMYDPITDKWTRLPDIPVPVHGVTGLAYINGWIHLPGGGTRKGGSSGSKHHQVVRSQMQCR